MAPAFISLPTTIRERIYAKLVTYLPSTSERENTPSSPICKLLTVNRQCNIEVLEFLKSQLCVLVQTNDAELFVRDIIKEASVRRLPIVAQLKNKDDVPHKDISNAPVAMMVEFYVYNADSSSTAFPAFLIPASSLKPLLNSILWLPNWTIWTTQSSLSLETIDTFRYSKERAEELLVQPWADWFLPQKFAGVEFDPSVSTELASTIKQRLLGKYDAAMLVNGLLHLGGGAREHVKNGELEEAIRQCSKTDKYARLIWNNHLSCLQAGSTPSISNRDLVWRMWIATETNCAWLFRCVLSAARGGDTKIAIAIDSAKDDEGFKRARRVGEDCIRFLSKRPQYTYEATFHDPEVRSVSRNHQAVASYRLAGVCKGLGDVDAAVGYLREAMKYDPKTAARFTREIGELVSEGAKDDGESCSRVVQWDLVAPAGWVYGV